MNICNQIMNEEQTRDILARWKYIAEYVSGKSKTEEDLHMEITVIRKYKYQDVCKALDSLFINSPALYGQPCTIKHLLDRLPEDTNLKIRANRQYGALSRSVSLAGMYQRMSFEDAITSKVVRDLGGYKHYCELDDKSAEFYQTKFIELYQEYAQRETQCIESYSEENPTFLITSKGEVKDLQFINQRKALSYGAEKATEQQYKEVQEWAGGETDPIAILNKYLSSVGKKK